MNEYHWGDFKGDPLNLIERYFDAHLYYANWGTRILMFGFPSALVDVDALRRTRTTSSFASLNGPIA